MSGHDSLKRKKGPDPPVLHRTAWLVPVSSPPISDGAILVHGGVILRAGSYGSLKSEVPAGTKVLDHGSSALIPALVNAHTHLELTALRGKIPLPQEGFASWLNELLPRRTLLTCEAQERGLRDGERQLEAYGTALYGDITNGACIGVQPGSPATERQVFLEVLGFNRQTLETSLEPDVLKAFVTTAGNDPTICLAAHSCYSASPDLMRQAKEWCRKRERTFSIHVAEHAEEIEFLMEGTGYCRALLETLGRWAPCWAHPRMSPAAYLERLGILDDKTLLVHAVHMTDADWEIVARNRSVVCFCPRSNENLNVGRPDLAKALEFGVVAALGTDSLASNKDLSLFAEAAHILENFSNVPPEAVLAMMTFGGAKALQRERDFGSLEPGNKAAFLVVSLPDSIAVSHLAETIIQQGREGVWEWGSLPMND